VATIDRWDEHFEAGPAAAVINLTNTGLTRVDGAPVFGSTHVKNGALAAESTPPASGVNSGYMEHFHSVPTVWGRAGAWVYLDTARATVSSAGLMALWGWSESAGVPTGPFAFVLHPTAPWDQVRFVSDSVETVAIYTYTPGWHHFSITVDTEAVPGSLMVSAEITDASGAVLWTSPPSLVTPSYTFEPQGVSARCLTDTTGVFLAVDDMSYEWPGLVPNTGWSVR
jgi:hypothetical protein